MVLLFGLNKLNPNMEGDNEMQHMNRMLDSVTRPQNATLHSFSAMSQKDGWLIGKFAKRTEMQSKQCCPDQSHGAKVNESSEGSTGACPEQI